MANLRRLLAVATFLPLAFLVAIYTTRLVQDASVSGAERAVFLVGAKDKNSRTLHLYENDVSFFEPCPYQRQPESFEDLTPLLKAKLGLEDSCISNPSVVSVSKNMLLMSLRIYTSKEGFKCTSAEQSGGQWSEGWTGWGGFGLVLLRRSKEGDLTVLNHMARIDDSTEDARLFKDDQGKVRMLYNRYRGGDPSMRGFKRLQRRSMHTIEIKVDTKKKTIKMQNEQELIYIFQERDEKNWVAWEGTTLMTYPQYPKFAPHLVLDWGSYDLAQDQMEITAISPVAFMAEFTEATGGWIRFSGGTPGIRLDKDRFLAVGHAVGDLSCFHQNRIEQVDNPAARKLLMQEPNAQQRPNVRLGYHACNASNPAPKDHYEWKDHFKNLDHKLPYHHPHWEYFFFLYTWSAHFPYKLTHISHSFLPYDALDHQGVYFPTGLQRMPDKSLLLTYGKDDTRTMAMTLSVDLVDEYLLPMATLDPQDYKFCTVGKGQPLIVHGQKQEEQS